MTALIAATVAIQPAAAAQTDVAEAEGVLLSGSGIVDVDDIAQLRGAYSASSATTAGGTTNQPLDLTALNSVGVRLGNNVDLLGANGILTLGVDGQFATTSQTGARGSSGLVGSDGAIDVGSGTGAGASTLDLNPLLTRVGADTSVLSNAQLQVGALASTISATRGATVTTASDYRIAGANLQLTSPAVARLATTLRTNVAPVSTSVNSALSGAVTTDAITGALGSLLAPAVSVRDTNVRATANLDLGPTIDGVLARPITDGAVTITPSTGTITVDLDALTRLNDQPANTPVLTDAAVAAINSSITNILGTRLPATLSTAVTDAVNATQVRVEVSATLSAIGAVNLPVNVTIDSTLGALAASGTATPQVSVSTGSILGISVAPVLRTLVSGTVVPALQTALRPVVGPTALTQLGTTLTTTTSAVASALSPVVLLLRQVIGLTVNAQDDPGFRDPRGYDPGARSVTALRLTVLPGVDAATVDLATSTVRATAFVAPRITAPTAGQQFSVPTDTSTRSVTVRGTGEPGASIALAAGGTLTATAPVDPTATGPPPSPLSRSATGR